MAKCLTQILSKMAKTSGNIQVIRETIIKPSSPTPPSLKHYKLSRIDQLYTSSYTPLALFFPSKSSESYDINEPILEKSLSELLSSYYPFAGRRVGNISIECNDIGAVFREVVRLNCSVSEILKKPHACIEDAVFPSGLPYGDNVPNGGDNLVVAQLTHFSCGGKALSLCLCHKLGDGATLFNFFSDWAAMARKTIEKPNPLFNSAHIYPPIESQYTPEDYDITDRQRHISSRIIFGSSNINHVKAMIAAKTDVKSPTRVEVVTALLTKFILAASMEGSTAFKSIVLFVVVNLRSRTRAPIQRNSVGNFLSYLHIPVCSEEDMKLESLISKIRNEKIKSYEKYKRLDESGLMDALHEEKKMLEEIGNKKVDFYSVTSRCGFPYQDLDFGWGKPLKVTSPPIPKKNYFVLVNNQTGKGVEVIGTIEEKVLNVLKRDQEFLSIATLE